MTVGGSTTKKTKVGLLFRPIALILGASMDDTHLQMYVWLEYCYGGLCSGHILMEACVLYSVMEASVADTWLSHNTN